LALGETRERGRQLAALGHRRPVDEHRHDRRVAAERGRQLLADEVVGVVEATGAVRVHHGQPRGSDHGEHDVGAIERLGDHLGELGAAADAAEVEEHLALAERVDQAVVEPAHVDGGVVAPVADEDLRLGCHTST
jgi:hypothetical protein